MNGVNTLFVISCIFVPLLLISINYESISDFYAYSVPLKSLIVTELSDISTTFQEVYDDNDSECFTTPNGNLFCYPNPVRFNDDGSSVSFVKGESRIEGEIHFDPVDIGANYFLMLNMTLLSEDKALITFADKGYKVGNNQITLYEITDDFEFSTVIEKFDTFIAKCNNYEGTSVTLVQYLGIKTINETDYFLTWHTSADSEQGVTCNYPQIIQHSLDYNFRQL